MTSSTKPSSGRSLDPVVIDVVIRGCVAGALGIFVVAAFEQWRLDTSRLSLLMLIMSESLTVGIVLFSRVALQRDWQPTAVIASFVASFFFLALKLEPGNALIAEGVGVALQITGTALQIYAKLSLGRSFGILPATRQLVTRGAYRWLRHPIYFSYLIAHIGFLLTNFSLQNVAVFAVLYGAQIIRIEREERILRDAMPGYTRYCDRVRFRLLPGIY